MSQIINFTKMQALGNDFVLIDDKTNQLELNAQQIKLIADRKFGIGCDQILIINPKDHSTNVFNYKIYNHDATQASQCGNGARCVIKYIKTQYDLKQNITLCTKNRTMLGYYINDENICIEMGTPNFNPKDLPANIEFANNNIYYLQINNFQIQCGLVSFGNPHVIIELIGELKQYTIIELEKLATNIQNSQYFPESVNVNFFTKLSNNEISLLTYERGSGFTLACGSGACATVAYLILKNLIHYTTTVKMQGGNLLIEWLPNTILKMIGNATTVFTGTIIV